MSKKCLYCGADIDDEAIFCDECGKKQEEEIKTNVEKEEFREEIDIEIEKIAQAQVEQERLAKERAEKEAEVLRLSNEKIRLEQEKSQQKKEEEERLSKERIAQAQVEQEKLAKERAEKEAEVLRLSNEKIRLEQEISQQKKEEEEKKLDEQMRTFNGVVYSSIEEKNKVVNQHIEEENKIKIMRKMNSFSIISLICSIITYPLLITIIFWIPSLITSLVLGIISLKNKAKYRWVTIIALLLDIFFVILFTWSLMQ